jgi:hypothetical protein
VIFINKLNIMNRSYSKIRHIQESNVRLEKRVLLERVIREGGIIKLGGIIPNVGFFKQNPNGVLNVDDVGSVLHSVNKRMTHPDHKKMYSDELIKGGDYDYEFVPMEKTMRSPQGEPVVNLSQNGQLVSSFMPEKGEDTQTTPTTPATPTTQNIDSNNSFMR